MTIKLQDAEKLKLAAERLKAIAHPSRITIIELLHQHVELMVTDIHTKMEMEQAVVSQHLKILRSKGILNARRDANKTFYSLANPEVIDVINCVSRCSR